MIVYLHGFRSSPLSFKARLLAQRMAELGRAGEYVCPQLPPSPREAVELVAQLVESRLPPKGTAASPSSEVYLIGSSLGGYYATWLAEKLGCPTVLLNPAVRPARDLEQHVGMLPAWHSQEPFEFKREFVDELRALQVQRITRPQRYFLVAATGDEVLDWHEMVAHYPGARQRIIQGSDHGISDFAQYMDEVLSFCNVHAG